MQQEVSKHKLAYLVLCIGLAVFLIAFLGFWPNRVAQRAAVLCVMIFYSIWGILTHLHSDTITKRVALEYATAALFGGSLLIAITL